jgi:hypothetical protein
MNTASLKISPEILRLIGEIDEFKGSWREMAALLLTFSNTQTHATIISAKEN